MKIATYNNKNDYLTPDPGDYWIQRQDKIRQIIQMEDWDLFGLQEVTVNQRSFFEGLPGYTLLGEARDDEPNSECTPILFKTEKFELVSSGTRWLSETPEVMSRDWEAACTRIFTWGTLIERESGGELLFICTHFDHMSELARRNSAAVLLAFIEEMQQEQVILVGDFNADNREVYYQCLTSRLLDARQVAACYQGPDGTCTGVDFTMTPDWNALENIDYLFVSPNISVARADVLTYRLDKRYPSDHFPVACEITFGEK